MLNQRLVKPDDVQHRIDAYPALLEALTDMLALVESKGLEESMAVHHARLVKARAEFGALPR